MSPADFDKLSGDLLGRCVVGNAAILGNIVLHDGATNTKDLGPVHVGVHDEEITPRNEPFQWDGFPSYHELHPLKLVEHFLKEVGACAVNVRSRDGGRYET